MGLLWYGTTNYKEISGGRDTVLAGMKDVLVLFNL